MHLKYLYAAESIANVSTVHLGIATRIIKNKIEVLKRILKKKKKKHFKSFLELILRCLQLS